MTSASTPTRAAAPIIYAAERAMCNTLSWSGSSAARNCLLHRPLGSTWDTDSVDRFVRRSHIRRRWGTGHHPMS